MIVDNILTGGLGKRIEPRVVGRGKLPTLKFCSVFYSRKQLGIRLLLSKTCRRRYSRGRYT